MSHHQWEMYSKYVKDSLHLNISCRVALTCSHSTRRNRVHILLIVQPQRHHLFLVYCWRRCVTQNVWTATWVPPGLQSWQFVWDSVSQPSEKLKEGFFFYLFVLTLSLLSLVLVAPRMCVRQNPEWTPLAALARYSQRGKWAAFTPSCSYSFAVVLNISGSKRKKNKQDRASFFCKLHVCV